MGTRWKTKLKRQLLLASAMPSHNQNGFRAADFTSQRRLPHADPAAHSEQSRNIAAIYNQAGNDYLAYADGDPRHLFHFDGPHAYADRYVWAVLEAKLSCLRASGARSVSLLDAGCGPGTWLRRLVIKAHELGFSNIHARGFDIAQVQVQRARSMASDLSRLPGVSLAFDVADLGAPLPEANASVDLALCLYSVLSHLPASVLTNISAEMGRVTSGHFVTTVRAVGSTPTAFVDSMEKTLRFKRNHDEDQCEIDLKDGRQIAMSCHLFTASELRSYFSDDFEIEELRGLDLFHNRFMPDPRWNPPSLKADSWLLGELARLEETYAADPVFMDRATHLLLTARRRTYAVGKSLQH